MALRCVCRSKRVCLVMALNYALRQCEPLRSRSNSLGTACLLVVPHVLKDHDSGSARCIGP